jgi:exopolysaccharide biosynthesis polyprenyl glycosylphosphotransferase
MLAAADVSAGAAALLLVVELGPGRGLAPSTLLTLVLLVFACKLLGLYDRDELVLGKSTLDEAPRLMQVSGLYTLVVWLLQDVLLEGGLTRAQVLGLWSSSFVLVFLGRSLARRVSRRATSAERILVVGEPSIGRHLRGKVDASPAKADVVAAVPLDDPRVGRGLAGRADFQALVRRLDVHRVIVAPETTDSAEMLDLIRVAKALGVRVSVLPRLLEVVGSTVEFDQVDGVTMLGVRRFGLTRSSWLLKRSFDLAGAALIIVLSAPLMIALAFAIKVDSRGPVFFRQVRVGRDGARFRIFKFRSMVADADARKDQLRHRNEAATGLFKIAADPRVTRVGRVLRKTSLDELPQLFNVLRGQMSLVGPRPLVVEEDARIEGLDRSRLHLTPGMTGPWQVLGSSRIPIHEMVSIDYLYVANWSLWTDLKILLRTAARVVGRDGI